MKIRMMWLLFGALFLGLMISYPQGKQAPAAKAGGAKVIALSPRGTPPAIKLIPLAQRPATLDGKTVYFVDDGFQGGEALLKEMIGWFNRNMPNVKTEFRKKGGGGFDAVDKPLIAEIKEKGDAMVMATGH